MAIAVSIPVRLVLKVMTSICVMNRLKKTLWIVVKMKTCILPISTSTRLVGDVPMALCVFAMLNWFRDILIRFTFTARILPIWVADGLFRFNLD